VGPHRYALPKIGFTRADPDFTLKRRRHAAPPKHTTLSLLKTHNKPQSTSAKIAALEAKLGVLERERTSKEAEALLSEVLGAFGSLNEATDAKLMRCFSGPNAAPSSLPPKPPASIVPAANADGMQSVPRLSRTVSSQPSTGLGIGSKPGNLLLNLGVVPSSIKSAVSRPPALSAQEKDKPGKAAMQASLGIVRRK
jgi:hypothetical protein